MEHPKGFPSKIPSFNVHVSLRNEVIYNLESLAKEKVKVAQLVCVAENVKGGVSLFWGDPVAERSSLSASQSSRLKATNVA